jgi:methylated-DNA-protein-cysteine methyltransferase-like protein
MADFFEKAWDVACQVPIGRVTSYGAIARYLGTARSARMVGWAMNNSRASKVNVPAHRVVNSKGLLTGKHHFHGSNVMRELLESEGIQIEGDQIVNFEDVFWDPVKELGIQ